MSARSTWQLYEICTALAEQKNSKGKRVFTAKDLCPEVVTELKKNSFDIHICRCGLTMIRKGNISSQCLCCRI